MHVGHLNLPSAADTVDGRPLQQSGTAYRVSDGKELFDKKTVRRNCQPFAFAGGAKLIRRLQLRPATSTTRSTTRSRSSTRPPARPSGPTGRSQGLGDRPRLLRRARSSSTLTNRATRRSGTSPPSRTNGTLRSQLVGDKVTIRAGVRQRLRHLRQSTSTGCVGVAADANTLYLPTEATPAAPPQRGRRVQPGHRQGEVEGRGSRPSRPMMPLKMEGGNVLLYVEAVVRRGRQDRDPRPDRWQPADAAAEPARTSQIENGFYKRRSSTWAGVPTSRRPGQCEQRQGRAGEEDHDGLRQVTAHAGTRRTLTDRDRPVRPTPLPSRYIRHDAAAPAAQRAAAGRVRRPAGHPARWVRGTAYRRPPVGSALRRPRPPGRRSSPVTATRSSRVTATRPAPRPGQGQPPGQPPQQGYGYGYPTAPMQPQYAPPPQGGNGRQEVQPRRCRSSSPPSVAVAADHRRRHLVLASGWRRQEERGGHRRWRHRRGKDGGDGGTAVAARRRCRRTPSPRSSSSCRRRRSRDVTTVDGSWLTDKVYAKTGVDEIVGYDTGQGHQALDAPLAGQVCAASRHMSNDGRTAIVFEPEQADQGEEYPPCNQVGGIDLPPASSCGASR